MARGADPESGTPSDQRVRRRLVLFVHGQDPRGASVYHRLMSEAAAEERRRRGLIIEVGPRERHPDGAAWSLGARWPDGSQVRTRFQMLAWDDLIRARWDRGLWSQFRTVVSWFGRLAGAGIFAKVARTRTTRLALLALPTAIVVLCLLLVVIAGLVGWLIAWVAEQFGMSGWSGLLGAVVLLAGPWLWRQLDSRLNLCWLGRGYRYLVDLHLGRVDGLEARLDAQAAHLVNAAQDDTWDEILVVGHSSGAINAPLIVGRALGLEPKLSHPERKLSVLTVGQGATGYTFLGMTARHLEDLGQLVRARDIPWLNVTSPSDPAASYWPPLAFTPFAQSNRVVSRSPRFHQSMAPDDYRRLRRDPMRFHFHYMQAADDPLLHDWFAMIAGPQRLKP